MSGPGIEHLLRSVFDGAPIAMVVIDQSGLVSMWNPAAERLFGWSASEVEGKPPPYVLPDDLEAFRLLHREAFSGQPVPEMLARRARRDGSTMDLSVSRAALRDATGAVVGILGMFVDVTARVRSEAEQRRSEANLRELIEHAPHAIVVHRLGYIVYVNSRMVSLLGYAKPGDLVGRSIMNFFLPGLGEWASSGSAPDRSVDGRPVDREVLLGQGGVRIDVELESSAIVFDGERATVLHLRDLTERERLERQLRMSDRLATVGRLAAGVGHEINNPLAYVMGNLEAMARKIDALGPSEEFEEIRLLLSDAQEGSERIRRIVRDLKVFSQRPTEERAAIDVRSVLDSCANMAKNEIRHRARLRKRYGETPLAYVDSSRLAQVFLNLLINAAQAIPEGSADQNEVTIETSFEGQEVVVCVRDTGVGIAPELRSRIFEPFFTTKEGGGVGLGLSISHSLLRSMGGSISVESEVGRGTTFRVSLPIATEANSANVDNLKRPPPVFPRRRILVIDDEPLVGQTLANLLADHEVTAVASGREALAHIEAGKHFEVVLCDLMMPERSGADFYERVRARWPALGQRIVFMTGGAFTPHAQEFLASVPNACVEKPFDIERLSGIIDRAERDPE
ncbi:MAG TPA: PAS domain S-box protein [Polyangiaceae bacterium]|nr:PAS domain S-box protein [Polyangiaceae bacterium]